MGEMWADFITWLRGMTGGGMPRIPADETGRTTEPVSGPGRTIVQDFDVNPYDMPFQQYDAVGVGSTWPYNPALPSYGIGSLGRAVNRALWRNYLYGNADAATRPGLNDVTNAVYYDIASPQAFVRPTVPPVQLAPVGYDEAAGQ